MGQLVAQGVEHHAPSVVAGIQVDVHSVFVIEAVGGGVLCAGLVGIHPLSVLLVALEYPEILSQCLTQGVHHGQGAFPLAVKGSSLPLEMQLCRLVRLPGLHGCLLCLGILGSRPPHSCQVCVIGCVPIHLRGQGAFLDLTVVHAVLAVAVAVRNALAVFLQAQAASRKAVHDPVCPGGIRAVASGSVKEHRLVFVVVGPRLRGIHHPAVLQPQLHGIPFPAVYRQYRPVGIRQHAVTLLACSRLCAARLGSALCAGVLRFSE